MPGSFHPFHSALLRYLCGVLPLVTSNFNSIVLQIRELFSKDSNEHETGTQLSQLYGKLREDREGAD
jgi:hypothetical protein